MGLLLCVSLYFNVRFGLIILRTQDSLEESLDIMDERYASISRILKIPLFHDSPEIRNVLQDIDAARSAILYTANILTEISESEDTGTEQPTDK